MCELIFLIFLKTESSIGGHGGIGKKGDNESRFKEILDRIARYIAGYVDLPIFNRNYMLSSDLFQTQQNQTDAILLMAANSQQINNVNGLSVLQEIDRDGVELRLVNQKNETNDSNSNQQQTSDQQLNDSTDDDFINLSSNNSDTNNSFSLSQQTNSTTAATSNNGQLLSVNGLENLAIASTSSASNVDLRRISNARLSNGHIQTMSILDSSNLTENDNQESNQETTRVIKF